jgi:hypothetical protein
MEIHGTGLATQGFESPRLQTSPELVTFELQIKGRSLSDEASLSLDDGAKSGV